MSDHCSIPERERWKSVGNKTERLMTMMRPGNVNMEKLTSNHGVTASHPVFMFASTAPGHHQEAEAIS